MVEAGNDNRTIVLYFQPSELGVFKEPDAYHTVCINCMWGCIEYVFEETLRVCVPYCEIRLEELIFCCTLRPLALGILGREGQRQSVGFMRTTSTCEISALAVEESEKMERTESWYRVLRYTYIEDTEPGCGLR